MSELSNDRYQQDYFADPGFGISNGQWNLLIIAVDQLTVSHPSLAGIWLLIATPNDQNLTLVPVFPPIAPEPTPNDSEWDQIFSLTSKQEPNFEFLDKISEQVLWDEYLMIDKSGMDAIWETVNHLDTSSQENELPTTGMDFELSLGSQAEMWKTICLQLSKITDLRDFSFFLDQIKPHLHTDIDLDEISQELYFKDKSQVQLGCEFPTLTLNSP
jgi:hypothetical protein